MNDIEKEDEASPLDEQNETADDWSDAEFAADDLAEDLDLVVEDDADAGLSNEDDVASTRGGERLQKLMARAGIASRRAAEEMIAAGRVSVNGHVITKAGAKADPAYDTIIVDGHPLRTPGGTTVVLLHKPAHVVTTKKDPEGRATVTDYLPHKLRHLHPVGRLDYDTSGALLLTDDGALTQLLTHPSHGVPKVYQARVRGQVAISTIKKLEAGIHLPDGLTAPCRIRLRAQSEKNALLQITLQEGRNRQVRRMLESVGHPVRALRRVRIGTLGFEELLPGQFRALLPGEVNALRRAAERRAEKPSSRQRAAKPKRAASTRTSQTAKTQAPRPKTASFKMSRRDDTPPRATNNRSTKPAPRQNPLMPRETSNNDKPRREYSPTRANRQNEMPPSGNSRVSNQYGAAPHNAAQRDAQGRNPKRQEPRDEAPRDYSRTTPQRNASRTTSRATSSGTQPNRASTRSTPAARSTSAPNARPASAPRANAPRTGAPAKRPTQNARDTAAPSSRERPTTERGAGENTNARNTQPRIPKARGNTAPGARSSGEETHPLAERIENRFRGDERKPSAQPRRSAPKK